MPHDLVSCSPWLRRGAPALLLGAALLLGGCEAVDRVRMKLIGITVDQPEPETAEWVLKQALLAASDKDEQRGWDNFQKMLHSSERTTNALRGWYQGNWPRMRKQAPLYLDSEGRFVLRDLRVQQNEGVDFFVESKIRDLPTPCSVYIDHNNNNVWRIKRCSL